MSAPHRRPALIILVVVAALACLGLGWWQWGRFESSSGTAQNLGYALQWPLFAGFVVFAYFRFVRLERDTAAQGTEAPETAEPSSPAESAAPARRRVVKRTAPREIPAGILPERPTAARDDDPVLAEYNKYLADLHAQDVRERMHAVGLDGPDTERRAG
ncbi:transcriptional regulator [Nocardia sp. BSTN01]|uniref:transcriptional regulator n=1 Tax=Nocardia sp. BSTN01 TaxID=2783665 RepID=UPI0028153DBF|nr:transcriptional regulator [Nocardia sp. BSTN01]